MKICKVKQFPADNLVTQASDCISDVNICIKLCNGIYET